MMDAFEINKILGAFLMTLTAVVGISITAEVIFSVPPPDKPGYEIAVAAPAPAQAAASAPAAEPLPVLMAKADAGRGQAAIKACAACHTFVEGGANRVGPNLWNVVGGPKAHIQGFRYSAALAERGSKGERWGYDELDKFLANPRSYLPGTAMAFAGIQRADQRADILAYLRTLSSQPAPLPE